MKKSGRKLVGVLLAASMAVTTIFPMQGIAANGQENGYEDAEGKITTEGAAADALDEGQQPAGEVKPEEEVTGQEVPGEEQEPAEGKTEPEALEEGQEPAEETKPEALEEGQKPAEETKPEALEEGQKPADGMQEADGKALENGQEDGAELTEEEVQPDETAEGTGEAEMRTFMLPQESGEESIMPLAEKYDIDKPVIESFEFKENGQALTVDDTLHFTMSAYDADSGIQSIYVYVSCIDTYGYGSSVIFEKSGEGNLYVGELLCSGLKGNHFYISNIRVEDKAQNYVDWDTWKDGEYLYTFTLDNKIDVDIDENVSISNFQMQTNPANEDGKLRIGDTVTYTADITCGDEEIESVSMHIGTYANGLWKSEYLPMEYNADTQTLTSAYTVTDKTYPGEWELYSISVYTKSKKSYTFYPSQIEPDAELKFVVVQDDFDTEKPVIESIAIDKNGEWVTAGDVIHITVKVSEENPSEYATAYFYPQVTNVSASCYVGLKLNADTKEYTGTIEITEDAYPCEWALTDLYICDEIGHSTGLYDFKSDWYNTYPWYYKVKPGDTYREDFKDVTFKFYGFAEQEDGSFQPDSLISSQTVRVGRRATLNDLKVSFPSMEGVHSEWRYGEPYQLEWEGYGTVVDENAEILFKSTSDMDYPMTAIYDKGCANVSLTYMSKEAGQTSKMIPMFVDKEAAYKDVLSALELPEDAQTEEFAGFKLSYSDEYHNEDSQVGKMSYISVEAQYNNCQVAWNTRYIGKDGKEASKVITKSYLDGTNISDALAGLEEPEGASGMEFEAWVLTKPDGTQTITQPMANLDVAAVYRGKTTVDASYTYRGEDGAITTESKLMLLEGEGLSSAAIQGEATEVFKNVSHLKGLVLSEWESIVSVDQARYKEIQFRALYYNCAVTLKYPDNTCQYIVVDKGAKFALPTENDKYWDIIWAGYDKGAAVVINEDTEFTVNEFKDGVKEETGGVKLSEEEIAKITEEIKNTAEEETIVIDMKKATVIPKEVQEAIKGKSVNIVLKMEGYSWTLNGTDVAATDLKDIDLEVKIDTNAIPSSLVASIAGDKPATQISLTHNGEFGFRADLTLNLGSENSGSAANLYYYDSDGKLVFVNAGQVGADGATSLSFSHASDYVVVIDKTEAPDDDTKKEDTGKDDDTKKEDTGKDDDTEKEDTGKDDDTKKEDTGKDDDTEKEGAGTKKDNTNDNETANIKKNRDNFTTDSGKSEAEDTDSGKRKSPKTGEQ